MSADRQVSSQTERQTGGGLPVPRGLTLGGQPADHRLHAPGCQAAGALHALLVSIADRGHQRVGFLGAGVGLLETLTGATHHRQLQDPLQRTLLLLAQREGRQAIKGFPARSALQESSPGVMEPAAEASLRPGDLGGAQAAAVSGWPTGKATGSLLCSPGSIQALQSYRVTASLPLCGLVPGWGALPFPAIPFLSGRTQLPRHGLSIPASGKLLDPPPSHQPSPGSSPHPSHGLGSCVYSSLSQPAVSAASPVPSRGLVQRGRPNKWKGRGCA